MNIKVYTIVIYNFQKYEFFKQPKIRVTIAKSSRLNNIEVQKNVMQENGLKGNC